MLMSMALRTPCPPKPSGAIQMIGENAAVTE